MIVESDTREDNDGFGYRISLWFFETPQKVALFWLSDLEALNTCISAGVLRSSGTIASHTHIEFFTAEKHFIKLWKFESNGCQLAMNSRMCVK